MDFFDSSLLPSFTSTLGSDQLRLGPGFSDSETNAYDFAEHIAREMQHVQQPFTATPLQITHQAPIDTPTVQQPISTSMEQPTNVSTISSTNLSDYRQFTAIPTQPLPDQQFISNTQQQSRFPQETYVTQPLRVTAETQPVANLTSPSNQTELKLLPVNTPDQPVNQTVDISLKKNANSIVEGSPLTLAPQKPLATLSEAQQSSIKQPVAQQAEQVKRLDSQQTSETQSELLRSKLSTESVGQNTARVTADTSTATIKSSLPADIAVSNQVGQPVEPEGSGAVEASLERATKLHVHAEQVGKSRQEIYQDQHSIKSASAVIDESMAVKTNHQTTKPDVVQTQQPALVRVNHFDQDLQNTIKQMQHQNMREIEVQLDPPELGSILVKLQLNKSEAQLQFTAHLQQTREMIEQSMHRLREMFENQGQQLVKADVSSQHEHPSQSNQHAEAMAMNQHMADVTDEHSQSVEPVKPLVQSDNMLDHYI